MNEQQKPSFTKDDLTHLKYAREFAAMVATPGWKLYTTFLQTHFEQKRLEAMQICESLNEAMKCNAAKGAMLGLKLALDLPHTTIKVADEIRSSKTGDEI